MQHVDAGHRLEQLALQMGGGSDTTRRHGELTGIGLGIGDKLVDRPRWNREVRYHDVGHTGDASNRRDVAAEIETKLFVQRSTDRIYRSDEEKRIAVRERARDRLGGDIAARARPSPLVTRSIAIRFRDDAFLLQLVEQEPAVGGDRALALMLAHQREAFAL